MKKVLVTLFIIGLAISGVCAENFPNSNYKIIQGKQKIVCDSEQGIWSKVSNKKFENYYVKTIDTEGNPSYVDSGSNFAFSTGCDYEFITEGKLIGYSNKDLKFYEINYKDGDLKKNVLPVEEVMFLFPEYKVIELSKFSETTNALKVKKNFGDLNIILFNDTDNDFGNYTFTSGNSKFRQYGMRGFLTVSKTGMIQFSRFDDKTSPWYVLLVR